MIDKFSRLWYNRGALKDGAPPFCLRGARFGQAKEESGLCGRTQ